LTDPAGLNAAPSSAYLTVDDEVALYARNAAQREFGSSA
jgi:hypothetical protein